MLVLHYDFIFNYEYITGKRIISSLSPLHRFSIFSRTAVNSRNEFYCPHTVGIPCVDLYKKVYLYRQRQFPKTWIVLFHNYFSSSGEQPNNIYKLICRTTNCLLYNNILQMLLLYKVLVYYNKFDSMKLLGILLICHIAGCVEHRLENIAFYDKKMYKKTWLPLDPRWFATTL